MKEKVLQAIKKIREGSKKRGFSQTFDLVINLKEIDMKKPTSKITDDVFLPHGRGADAMVTVFSEDAEFEGANNVHAHDLNELTKNKREAKNLVKKSDFFLSEAKLMPAVGKALGQFLGSRGKLPKVLAGSDVKKMVKDYKRAVRIKLKDAPVIQTMVGNETMDDAKIAENIEEVLKFIEHKLPSGKSNIGKVSLKLTMGKPEKVEVF